MPGFPQGQGRFFGNLKPIEKNPRRVFRHLLHIPDDSEQKQGQGAGPCSLPNN